MDLVSFESEEEWNLVKSFMDGAGIKEIWTSGRLCDAEVIFLCKHLYWCGMRAHICANIGSFSFSKYLCYYL